jgi:hypothetical protein
MFTYRFGYGTQRMTLLRMRAQPSVAQLDPEFWRRLKMLLREARRAGVDLGIGGAGRSVIQQETLFKDRHVEVGTGGCCLYQGKRWALKAGKAHAAPPGRSYHEATTPAGGVLAVDLVGWEDGWVTYNMARFGLHDIATERWHMQPVDVPVSRSFYDARIHHPLPKWKVR